MSINNEIQIVSNKRQVEFNLSFFKKWNPEMAYVLGLFFTDGDLCINLSKNKNASPYYARLYSKDKEFLLNILKLMEGTAKIGHIKKSIFKKNDESKGITRGELFYFHLGKYTMLEDLVGLGLKVSKDEKLLFPTIPNEYVRHFIRGCWDGNGSIYKEDIYFRAQIGSFSKEFIAAIQNELVNNGLKKLKIYKNSYSKRPTYFLKYNTMKDLTKLYEYLYSDINPACKKESPYLLLRTVADGQL